MARKTRVAEPIVIPDNFRYMAKHANTPKARAWWAAKIDAMLNPPKPKRIRRPKNVIDLPVAVVAK